MAMQRSTVARVCLGLAFLAATARGSAGEGPALKPTEPPPPEGAVAVERLLADVKEALASANEQMSRGTLVLDSVTLELEAVAIKREGVRLKFFIFEFGRQDTLAATSRIALLLARPGAEKPTKAFAQQSKLVQALSRAIVEAEAAASQGWDTIEDLVPTSVSCEVSFGVTKEANGGLDVAAMSLAVGAGRLSSLQSVQTIRMAFTPKKQGMKAPSS
jgi:hypothetical protein